MSVDQLFNEEQIAALKAGETLGGSLKDGLAQATTFTPTSSVPITQQDKNLKPRIRDGAGNTIDQTLVTTFDTEKYNKINAKQKLAELKAAEEQAKEQEALDPQKILAALNAVDRRLRRIEKKLSQEAKDS